MYKLYVLLVALVVSAGCFSPVEMKQAEARQAEAIALQQQAQAAAAQAEAQKAMYEQETARFDILADAAKPVYWPFAVAFVVLLLLVYINHRAQLAHMAMLTGQRAENVRLLPGDSGFERALIALATERGVRPIKGREQGIYYLPTPDGGKERVKYLTVVE